MHDTGTPLRLKIAQTLHALARYDAAAAAYRFVLERVPDHLGALIGLAEALSASGEYDSALAFFEAAAALEPPSVPLRIRIADMLRALRRFADAERRYEAVLAEDPGNPLCCEHLGDCAASRAERETALNWYEAAEAVVPPRETLSLKKARVLHALSRFEAAEAAYAAVLERSPQNLEAAVGIAETVSARGDYARALSLFESAAGIDPASTALQIRIADLLRACGRLSDAKLTYQKILREQPGRKEALVGIGLVEKDQLDLPAALEIFEDLVRLDPADVRLRLSIVRLQRDLDRPDDAAATLRALEATCAVDPETMQTEWLEHFCATLQPEAAAACIAGWGGHRNVPDAAVALTARTYAELGRWHDVLEFARERILEGRWQGGFADFTDLVMRAARITGRYADAFELLGALRDQDPDAAARDAFEFARDQVIEETRLLNLLGTDGDAPAAPLDATISDTFLARRADLFADLLTGRRQAGPPLRILWCADRNYLVGTAVSLFSTLAHNLEALRACTFIVYCSDDVVALAAELCGRIGAFFHVPIDVRGSDTLVSSEVALRTHWGLFTAGRVLSAAAYHRIFAVRRCLDDERAGRLLYIDSDTCLRRGIDEFAEFDLAGQPLGACRDEVQLITLRAAARIGAKPGSYFNSGVLLFDLEHPELPSLLDRTIEVATTEPHRLTFHDQCALNAAFAGKFTLLPERFNVLVKAKTEPETIANDALVLHFIMTPKPWDPLYPTANCEYWLREFSALAHVLEPGLLRRLLRLPYGARG